MIKTWEDLVGKYVLQSELKVFGLFTGKCKELEITFKCGGTATKWSGNKGIEAVRVCPGGYLTTCDEKYFKRKGFTKLTLEDFMECVVKDKTKKEYVECSIPKLSTAIALVEEGGVFHYKATEGLKPFWVEVKAPNYQSVVANWEHFHVKTETPITWKDPLLEYLNADRVSPCVIFSEFDMYGKERGLSEEEFITMCKIVVDGVIDSKENV